MIIKTAKTIPSLELIEDAKQGIYVASTNSGTAFKVPFTKMTDAVYQEISAKIPQSENYIRLSVDIYNISSSLEESKQTVRNILLSNDNTPTDTTFGKIRVGYDNGSYTDRYPISVETNRESINYGKAFAVVNSQSTDGRIVALENIANISVQNTYNRMMYDQKCLTDDIWSQGCQQMIGRTLSSVKTEILNAQLERMSTSAYMISQYGVTQQISSKTVSIDTNLSELSTYTSIKFDAVNKKCSDLGESIEELKNKSTQGIGLYSDGFLNLDPSINTLSGVFMDFAERYLGTDGLTVGPETQISGCVLYRFSLSSTDEPYIAPDKTYILDGYRFEKGDMVALQQNTCISDINPNTVLRFTNSDLQISSLESRISALSAEIYEHEMKTRRSFVGSVMQYGYAFGTTSSDAKYVNLENYMSFKNGHTYFVDVNFTNYSTEGYVPTVNGEYVYNSKVEQWKGYDDISGSQTIHYYCNFTYGKDGTEFRINNANQNVAVGIRCWDMTDGMEHDNPFGDTIPSYSFANILSASSSGEDYYCGNTRRIKGEFTNDFILSVGEKSFYGNVEISSARLQRSVSIGNEAFGNTRIDNIELGIISISKQNVEQWKIPNTLKRVVLPNCLEIEDESFDGFEKLSCIDTWNCISIGSRSFRGCSSLVTLDLPRCEVISGYAFERSSISSLYLRNDKVVTINGDTFKESKFSGDGKGVVYVPGDLLEEYENNDEWKDMSNRLVAIR